MKSREHSVEKQNRYFPSAVKYFLKKEICWIKWIWFSVVIWFLSKHLWNTYSVPDIVFQAGNTQNSPGSCIHKTSNLSEKED